MLQIGQKQPKEWCKLGKNNPKNDANWTKTMQKMMQIKQNNPKNDANWAKTTKERCKLDKNNPKNDADGSCAMAKNYEY